MHPSPEPKVATSPVEPQTTDVKNDEDKKEPQEPTQAEVPATGPDPDGAEDGQEEDIPVAEPEPMRL